MRRWNFGVWLVDVLFKFGRWVVYSKYFRFAAAVVMVVVEGLIWLRMLV